MRSNRIICTIISFLLAVFIALTAFCVALKFTILDPNFVSNIARDSQYSQQLMVSVQEQLANSARVSGGLPNSYFEDFSSYPRVVNDSMRYFNSCFSGEPFDINDTQANEKLRQDLTEYVKSKVEGGQLNQELEDDINALVVNSQKIYQNAIITPAVKTVGEVCHDFNQIATAVICILAFLAICCILILFSINQRRHRAAKYIIYAFAANSIFYLIVCASISISGLINRIAVTPKYAHTLLTSVMQSSLDFVWITAAIMILITSILIFMYSLIKPTSKSGENSDQSL